MPSGRVDRLRAQAALHRAFGFELHTFVHSAEASTAIAAHPAFSAATFVVGFVADPFGAQAATRALEFRNERDQTPVFSPRCPAAKV